MVNTLKNISEDCLYFKAFCEYLQKTSGITITPNKTYLVSARIRHVMIEHELTTLSDLVKRLNGNDKRLHQDIVNSMTTNETFWFRDGYPFHYFHDTLLPYWASSEYKDNNVRIWSAACSSGQEPYSLAMLCEEYKAEHSCSKKIDIFATDLSNDVLDQAKKGEFDHLSIGRGLSETRINQFFTSNSEHYWEVNRSLKSYIRFQSINLLDSYEALGKFDIIYCRNVLIYFTKETKTDILQRMHKVLKPGGLLCLGSSESLADAASLFKMILCDPGIIYQAI